MTARRKTDDEHESANEVRLVGRVSQVPEERVLPSGDSLWSFRLVIPRPPGRGRRTVDALDCTAWSARARRSVASWGAGDLVEVSGSVRRRFFRSGAGAASRVDIEVERGRIIRRATSG